MGKSNGSRRSALEPKATPVLRSAHHIQARGKTKAAASSSGEPAKSCRRSLERGKSSVVAGTTAAALRVPPPRAARPRVDGTHCQPSPVVSRVAHSSVASTKPRSAGSLRVSLHENRLVCAPTKGAQMNSGPLSLPKDVVSKLRTDVAAVTSVSEVVATVEMAPTVSGTAQQFDMTASDPPTSLTQALRTVAAQKLLPELRAKRARQFDGVAQSLQDAARAFQNVMKEQWPPACQDTSTDATGEEPRCNLDVSEPDARLACLAGCWAAGTGSTDTTVQISAGLLRLESENSELRCELETAAIRIAELEEERHGFHDEAVYDVVNTMSQSDRVRDLENQIRELKSTVETLQLENEQLRSAPCVTHGHGHFEQGGPGDGEHPSEATELDPFDIIESW